MHGATKPGQRIAIQTAPLNIEGNKLGIRRDFRRERRAWASLRGGFATDGHAREAGGAQTRPHLGTLGVLQRLVQSTRENPPPIQAPSPAA